MFFPSLESQIHVFCVWKSKKRESVSLSVLSDSFVTSWTVARQAALSIGFHWSGLAFLSPGHLPNPGIEPPSLALKSHFTSNISEFREVYLILNSIKIIFTSSFANEYVTGPTDQILLMFLFRFVPVPFVIFLKELMSFLGNLQFCILLCLCQKFPSPLFFFCQGIVEKKIEAICKEDIAFNPLSIILFVLSTEFFVLKI